MHLQKNAGKHVSLAILALCAVVLAVLTAGGCGGSSDSTPVTQSETRVTLVGEESAINSRDLAYLKSTDLILTSEDFTTTRGVLFTNIDKARENSHDVAEMLQEDGRVTAATLYKPTSSDIKAFDEMLSMDNKSIVSYDSLISGDAASIDYYTITTDEKGNIYSHVMITNNPTTSFDVKTRGSSEGYVTSGEEKPVVSNDKYMTDEQKIEAARKTAAERYVAFLTHSKHHLKYVSSDAAATAAKTPTRKELFVAWARDVLCAKSAFADSTPNLYEIAVSYNLTVEQQWTNIPYFYVSIATCVIPVHEFDNTTSTDGGNDHYFITQNCTLNATFAQRNHWKQKGSYYSLVAQDNYDSHKYHPNDAEIDEFYVENYYVTAALNNSDNSKVVCPEAEPVAVNNVTTYTTSTTYNVGGSANCGVAGDKPQFGLTLTGGFSSTNSQSYSTTDMETKLDDQGHSLAWTIYCTVLPKRDSTWCHVTYPADLAISTYNPTQQFVWSVPTTNRSADLPANSYNLQVKSDIAGCYSKNSGSLNPEYYVMSPVCNWTVTLPQAPLFCLSTDDLEFHSGDNNQEITVFSQGAWNMDTTGKPDWLDIEQSTTSTPNKVTVTMLSDNTTSDARTFTFTLKRTGGTYDSDTRVVTVTQYPKGN